MAGFDLTRGFHRPLSSSTARTAELGAAVRKPPHPLRAGPVGGVLRHALGGFVVVSNFLSRSTAADFGSPPFLERLLPRESFDASGRRSYPSVVNYYPP